MNGSQLSEYAMTSTPTEAHLIRELNQYCVLPSQYHDGSKGGFCVYYWYAALKRFHYIGRRHDYHEADHLIRKHIHRRWRRRYMQKAAPLFIRCEYCDYFRRRSTCSDTMCYDCYYNIWSQEIPDDYPALDADVLFY